MNRRFATPPRGPLPLNEPRVAVVQEGILLFLNLIVARTEDSRTYTDDSGTVTDSQGPVMRHSDREFGEVRKGILGVKTSLEGFDAREISLNDIHIVRVCCHSHQAAETDMGVLPFEPFDKLRDRGRLVSLSNHRGQDIFYFRLGESTFGLFCTKVQFKKDINDLTVLTPPSFNSIEKMPGIYRFHKGSIGQHEFQLVCLKMPYEMPFNVFWQLDNLGSEFLGTVLPEPSLSCPIGSHYLFAGVEFGNCHQFYSWRQFLIDSFDIIFYHSSWPVPSASGPASSGLLPDAAATCSWAVSFPRWP